MTTSEALAGIHPKAWIIIVVLGLTSGGPAVANLFQTSALSGQQPEMAQTLDRMDREMTDLRDRDRLLGDRLDVIEEKSEQRHKRITRDLDDLDRTQIDIQGVLEDLCESDRKCRSKRRARR